MTDKSKLIRLEYILSALLVLSAVFFHVELFAFIRALWRDEANSVYLALLPIKTGILQSLLYDSFPPGFTVLLHLWGMMFQTDLGLRIFGMVVGFGIIGSFLYSARLLKIGFPFLAFAIFELNSTAIRYGDSLRPYGIGIICMILSAGFLGRFLFEEKFHTKRAIPFFIFSILSVQFLYQNAFLLAGICASGLLIAAIKRERKKILVIILAGVSALASLTVYLPYVKAAREWSEVARVDLNISTVVSDFALSLGFWGQVLALFGILLVVLGLVKYLANKNDSAAQKEMFYFAFCSAVLGSFGYLFFMDYVSISPQPWHYLPLIGFLGILMDIIFKAVFHESQAMGFANVALITIILITMLGAYHSLQIPATNIDQIGEELNLQAKENDIIVIDPWYVAVSFHRYYKGSVPVLTIPPLSDTSIHRYDLWKEKLQEPNPNAIVNEAAAKTLREGNNIWFIGMVPNSLPALKNTKVELETIGQANGYENLRLYRLQAHVK